MNEHRDEPVVRGATATAQAPPVEARTRRAGSSAGETGHAHDDRSTIGLVRALFGDIADLVRQEAALVRAEMSEKVDQAVGATVSVGAGALVAYAGFLFVLLAAVLGLNEAIESPWLSALIVGGLVALIGLGLLASGRRRLEASSLAPNRSARSIRKDAELLKDETRRTP